MGKQTITTVTVNLNQISFIKFFKMGITHSTARIVAPLSFAIDFAAQQYGMLATPNMKDIHDANLSFWSPQPYFIAGFFFPQQLFQLAWLYRLWKLDGSKSAKNKKEVEIMTDFVPYYAVGNLCIASWMIFWNSSALKTANIFVLINSLTQLTYISYTTAPLRTLTIRVLALLSRRLLVWDLRRWLGRVIGFLGAVWFMILLLWRLGRGALGKRDGVICWGCMRSGPRALWRREIGRGHHMLVRIRAGMLRLLLRMIECKEVLSGQ